MRFNYLALIGLVLFGYIIVRVGAGQIARALASFDIILDKIFRPLIRFIIISTL